MGTWTGGRPKRVVIREVGLRDGLQSLPTTLPTERKREWIRRAYGAGLREIEVGSFVPARLLPQLADTGELVSFAKTLPELFASVLVPMVVLQPQARRIAGDDPGARAVLADMKGNPDLVCRAVAHVHDQLLAGHQLPQVFWFFSHYIRKLPVFVIHRFFHER